MPDLTFFNLRLKNVERCHESFHPVDDWSLTDWMTCVMGEVGEAAHLIKKLRRGEEVPTKRLSHELADIIIYLDLLAERFGIDLGDAVVEKFNITSVKVGSVVFLETSDE